MSKKNLQACKHTHNILTAAILHQNDKDILNGIVKFENISDDWNNTDNEDDYNSCNQGYERSAPIQINEMKTEIELESAIVHSNPSETNEIKNK